MVLRGKKENQYYCEKRYSNRRLKENLCKARMMKLIVRIPTFWNVCIILISLILDYNVAFS